MSSTNTSAAKRRHRWTVRNWLSSPGMRRLAVCPVCGLRVDTVGLTSLAYTFEVVTEDGMEVLAEQLWHRECLMEHDYEAGES